MNYAEVMVRLQDMNKYIRVSPQMDRGALGYATRTTAFNMARSGFSALLGIAFLLLPTWTSASPLVELDNRQTDDVIFSFREIFVPPSDYNIPKTLYGRTVQLADGILLATWYVLYNI